MIFSLYIYMLYIYICVKEHHVNTRAFKKSYGFIHDFFSLGSRLEFLYLDLPFGVLNK